MQDVKVILSQPNNPKNHVIYSIEVYDNKLAHDWVKSLRDDILRPGLKLEKEFCFLGFPNTHRTLDVLCDKLNYYIKQINLFNQTEKWQNNGLLPYVIEEYFTPDAVRFDDTYSVAPIDGKSDLDNDERYLGLKVKHDILNRLHNHFERLQGTVWKPSLYYQFADQPVKSAIQNLNLICHEIESLVLSQRKMVQNVNWVRPSQITSFHNAPRYNLSAEHKKEFSNGYDRRFGEVYMHWCQIGKTLMEVYRDEHAPDLTVGDDPTDISVGAGSTCEAINALRFYSGEFDIEWGRDVTYESSDWHRQDIDEFYAWLEHNGIDYANPDLSLGYLPIGRVECQKSFGTEDPETVWKIIGEHLNIYAIEVDGVISKYKYTDSYA